jgi:hypothetical protein
MIDKTPIEKLHNFLCQQTSFKNYGESVESLITGSAGNYISTDKQYNGIFCSVDDGYDGVVFYIRNDATADTGFAGGRNNLISRKVSYTIAFNAKTSNFEYLLISAINQIAGLEYQSTNFDNRNVATDFFGIENYNFEGYFYTIDFTALERITCPPVCRT